MKKVNLLYDATLVCNMLTKDSFRSGIFFVAYNVLLEFLKRPNYNVYLYADDLVNLKKLIKTYPEFSECKVYKFSILQEAVSYLKHKKNQNKMNGGLSLMRGIYVLTASLLKKCYSFWGGNSKLSDIDVYFSPMNVIPDFVRINEKIKSFTILHDTIPLSEECKHMDWTAKWFHKLVKSMNGEDYYFANSKFTKQEFLKYVPKLNAEHISVVPLSTGKPYRKIADVDEINEVKRKYNIPLDKKYMFSLCSLNPRKNLIFSIRNFLKFTAKNKLEDYILVLGGAYFDGFEKVMNGELSEFGNLSEKILRIGYVDDEDLSALYSGAEVFLFPSLYEGFGIPVLEAMQCGLPVICSNCTSIPEVIGDCGIQINPHSDVEMVLAMEKMCFDKPFYDECAQKGMERAKLFTWQKCGDIMDQKIQGVLSGV